MLGIAPLSTLPLSTLPSVASGAAGLISIASVTSSWPVARFGVSSEPSVVIAQGWPRATGIRWEP